MRKVCQDTRPGIGLPFAYRVADDGPGRRPSAPPSPRPATAGCSPRTGRTPAAGVWSLTEANKPVSDSFVGKSAFLATASFRSMVCSVPPS